MRRRPAAAVLAALLMSGALAGCSGDANSVANQAKAGDQKGYVAGDGQIEQIPPDRRADPIELSGTTVDGQAWTSTAARGKPLVVNVWASWCGPCDAEAPALKAVSEAFTGKVGFIGIDYREQAETGKAQIAAWGHDYPSLSDPAGTAILALQGKANSMPATLILDAEGRIAARVGGPVDKSTLTGLLQDVLATGPTPSAAS